MARSQRLARKPGRAECQASLPREPLLNAARERVAIFSVLARPVSVSARWVGKPHEQPAAIEDASCGEMFGNVGSHLPERYDKCAANTVHAVRKERFSNVPQDVVFKEARRRPSVVLTPHEYGETNCGCRK